MSEDRDRHIDNVVSYPSKDRVVAQSIRYLLKVLCDAGIENIVIGSTAVQAHLDYVRRLPGDCDVTIREEDIEKIAALCVGDRRLRFEQDPIACKLHIDDAYYLHLIPELMRYVDKVTGEVFARVQVCFPDRTDMRDLWFPTEEEAIAVRVPSIEYTFCLNLCPPIDANTFADMVAILQGRSLEPRLVAEFMAREPILGQVVRRRLARLSRVMERRNPDLLDRLEKVRAGAGE